jgi:hypothetical protein
MRFAFPILASIRTDRLSRASFEERTEYVPAWLDSQKAHRIYAALSSLKSGYIGASKFVVLVPIDWVPPAERVRYEGAQLFGHELRLDGYISDVVVGIKA